MRTEKIKSVEESVVIAMDGADKEIFTFLPYILQDIWEIGTDPATIIKQISKHFTNCADLKVLDLGCGKGAVSVKAAASLGCNCHGIDAIPDFIAYAKEKAVEHKVEHLCKFETGDIREKVKGLAGYDIIILGAIGPVFGDYNSTLTTLEKCLNTSGIFLIDDAYIDNNSSYSHPLIFRKEAIVKQIDMAGMELIEDDVLQQDDVKDSDDHIFDNLKMRCHELIEQHPEKRELFLDYIKKQEEENDVLENKVVCSTLVIKRKANVGA